MTRISAVLALALALGCAAESASPSFECTDGTCDESEAATVLGQPARDFYNGLTYSISTTPGLGRTHRQLANDQAVVLDADDSIHATFRLFLVPGPRYVLEYEERQGDPNGVSITLESLRLEGELALDGATLLFDDGDFASAEGKDLDGVDGIGLTFRHDIMRRGLAGTTIDMAKVYSTYGLEECSGEPAPGECPVELPN